MLSVKEQQIETVLLNTTLKEIENQIVVQHLTVPELDAENEQRYRETMASFNEANDLNSEMDRLKLENIRLSAKRTQLNKQCEDITQCLERARTNRKELANLLKEEEQAIDRKMREYEESLRKKAERFRETHKYYNEEQIKNEMEMINQDVIKLEIEEGRQQQINKELQEELTSMVSDLPEDLLQIVGKAELKAKLETLTDKCTQLRQTRDRLSKRRRVHFNI